MSEESVPKKGVNKAAIAIVLLSIVVIIQSVKIYLDYQQKVEVREQLSNNEEDLATTMQRLSEIKSELDAKIIEIDKLGGDVTELQKAKAEIDAQLKRNNTRSARDIQQLKDRVEGYEELLLLKDTEIAKLKSVNTELFSENKTLKTKQNTLSDSINKLTTSKEELAGKVALASQLKAENITVLAVSGKKERESPFRNRQLEKLKIEFDIADNKVAPIEGKKILVNGDLSFVAIWLILLGWTNVCVSVSWRRVLVRRSARFLSDMIERSLTAEMVRL